MRISDINKSKYLKAPPIELVEAFIKELDVSEAQFERFYSIPQATVSKVRASQRKLPPAYWHIIYEKIRPIYGAKYQSLVINKSLAKPLAKKKSKIGKHDRLKELRK